MPRSEFLASGPEMVVFSGIMEEWRDEHCERMDCCIDADGLPSLLMSRILLSKVDVDSLEEEDEGFFDQFM